MNFYARTAAIFLLAISLGQIVWAQTFKMSCELEGVIPALEDRKDRKSTRLNSSHT